MSAGSADNASPDAAKPQPQFVIDSPSSAGQAARGDAAADDRRISLDDVARVLLREKLLLTALELHTELTECGVKLQRLVQFFSNPANFEPAPTYSGLERTLSSATFDSLELGRNSDEGGVTRADQLAADEEDRVAVLEFELRRANDTIRSLRAELTRVAESQMQSSAASATDTTASAPTAQPSAEPAGHSVAAAAPPPLAHESRAINFLVHEYLLQGNFKLTAVTFSDEAADEDFEDWDSVGLNVSRPADLLALYREFVHATGAATGASAQCHVGVQCAVDIECNELLDDELMTPAGSDFINELNAENGRLQKHNEELVSELNHLRQGHSQLKQQLVDLQSSAAKPPALDTVATASPASDRRVPPWLAGTDGTLPAFVCAGAVAQRTRTPPPPPVLNRIVPTVVDQSLATLAAEVESPPGELGELVELLCVALPRVAPSVLLNRRHDLVSLLVSASLLCGGQSARTPGPLDELYNLVKKPDDVQRRAITMGCCAFAAHAGPTRTEAQLLPLVWEQMAHKHEERRVLAAELCCRLVAIVPPALSDSLLLSMLTQLLSDRSSAVRRAAVDGLATLCLYAEDADKLPQLCDLCVETALDASDSVASACRTRFAPALAQWAERLGRLQDCLYAALLLRLAECTSSNASECRQSASLFDCADALTPALFWHVLRTGERHMVATASGPPATDDVSIDDSMERDVVLFDSSEPNGATTSERWPIASEVFASDVAKFQHLKAAYFETTGAEWFATWPQLDFLTTQLMPQIASALNKMDCSSCQAAIPAAINLLCGVSSLFGRPLTDAKLCPSFARAAQFDVGRDAGGVDADDTQRKRAAVAALGSAALPAYAVGLFDLHNDKSWSCLEQFLRDTLSSLSSVDGSPSAALVTTLQLICERCPRRHNDVAALLCECLPSRSAESRRLAAECMAELVPLLDSDTVGRRALPALITLAADAEPQVRGVAPAGLISAAVAAGGDERRLDHVDKVRLQLAAVFDDGHPSVLCRLARAIAHAAPAMQPHFRDNFVLPHLAALAERQRAVSSTDAAGGAALADALFEAYSALSCCHMSPAAVGAGFLPGIRHLLRALGPQHTAIAASILRDAEAKLNTAGGSGVEARQEQHSSSSGSAAGSLAHSVVHTLRDLGERAAEPASSVQGFFRKKH